MLAVDRRHRILERVAEEQTIHIRELAHDLGVSEMTIRRDITRLERDGFLRRTYGGATAHVTRSLELAFNARALQSASAKRLIGMTAAPLVSGASTLFIGTGTTAEQLALYLPARDDVTIVTNSLPVASLLGTRPGRVVILGGGVRRHELCCVGPVASATVRRYHADVAVLSAAGLSARAGMTELDDETAEVHRLMTEHSDALVAGVGQRRESGGRNLMDALRRIFGVEMPLIAMCHLNGLPGRPRHDVAGGMDAVVEALARDVAVLQDAGVDGLLFCNENDLPYQTRVGVEVAAATAAAIGRLRPDIRLPFGVDLLWDPLAAVAVARATGAAFVREVFMGVFDSDMGLLAPDFGEFAGYRHMIGADDVAAFCNITPEFSRSVAGRSVAERARGAEYMGVDALLISGQAAGVGADMDDLREAKAAVRRTPVLANTGVDHETVESILALVDGVIVGTSLKADGDTWNPVDPARAARMVELVAAARDPAP